MSVQLDNFYTKPGVVPKDDGLRHYPNEDKIHITLPARILDIGSTGSGKTNIILNLIKQIGIFDKIVLLAKQLDEPLYEHLIKTYRTLEKKHHVKILLAIDNLKDLPSLEVLGSEPDKLIIAVYAYALSCDTPMHATTTCLQQLAAFS